MPRPQELAPFVRVPLMPSTIHYQPGIRKRFDNPGLLLRAGGRGFSPATNRVAPGYFYWKIEEK